MKYLVAVFTAAIAFTSIQAGAADLKGSKDHPMISRYAGSQIVAYQLKDFDEYKIALAAPFYSNRWVWPKVETLAGKITRILYRSPKKRSTLEIMRNYQKNLKAAGFESLFTCGGKDCSNALYNVTSHWKKSTRWTRDVFARMPDGQRYMAARLKRPEGDVYVALYIGTHTLMNSMRGPYVSLDVIQLKPMQSNMVKVDAAAMEKGIAKEGRVSIYGIYFDTGKTVVKPESKESLDEIAKLLKSKPKLKVFIVGHTDSVGTFDYNLDLSRRRANAVVAKLTAGYGIAKGRLIPRGVGPLAPVASNRAEAGRAKNRRVELVEAVQVK